MYVKGVPSAPVPKTAKQKATLHAVVAAPAPPKVSHVDVYLSEGQPFWGNETKFRERDAGMGPIANDAGMHLTAINFQVPVTDQPDPFGDVQEGEPLDQCIRG